MPDHFPWMDQVDRRLASIAALKLDWDSYGAEPISPDAIEACRIFLGALGIIAVTVPELGLPGIVPTSDSGVEIEWNPVGGAWANVEFTKDGRIEAIGTDKDGSESQFGFLDEQ